jgi:hypothetical protein
MLKLLLITIILLFSSAKIFSQASDFITVKKHNNRTIKTFFPGVPISFVTVYKRPVNGTITDIRHDSIFVKEWDVRVVPTTFGVTVLDTAGVYITGFHYKEIETIDVSDRTQFQQVTAGRILIIGGIGYTALNIINGAYLHEPITDSKNLKNLGIAAGAVGTGLLINYLSRHRRKYLIEYIRMDEVKKQLRGF